MGTKRQTKTVEEYAESIELDFRLVHAPRSEKQADGLLSIQKALIKYDSKAYSELSQHASNINDPSRDLTFALDKIQAIE